MIYPILLSPAGRPYIIIEFTAIKTGRIILASKYKQNIKLGSNSTIGFTSKSWTDSTDIGPFIPEGKCERYSWQLAHQDFIRECPYAVETYPEYLI